MTNDAESAIVRRHKTDYDEKIASADHRVRAKLISETAMRNILLTIMVPFFVVFIVATTTAYPTPAELWATLKPVNDTKNLVDSGGSLAPNTIKNSLGLLAERDQGSPTPDPDCFADLASADQTKLDRCAVAVYKTLIELEQERGLPAVAQALQRKEDQVVPQLRLAAAEVCRIKWTKSPIGRFSFDSPACEAANVHLASDER
jgi:hypothetical protein